MKSVRAPFIFALCAAIGFAIGFVSVADAATGTAALSWRLPTTYTDGSPLAASDITRIRVTCAFTPTGATASQACAAWSDPTIAGNATSATGSLTVPASGGTACFYFYATAGGVESAASNGACKPFSPVAPNPPTNVSVVVTVIISP